MDKILSDVDSESLKKVINLLADCTDEYLFIYNLSTDSFSISSKLVSQFNFPGNSFDHASLVLKNVICTEDIPRFFKEGEKLLSGRSVEHSIEYRLMDKGNNIVWLSSRGRVVIDGKTNQRLLVGRVSLIGQRMLGDNLTGFVTDLQLADDYRNAVDAQGKVSGFLMKLDIDNLSTINEQYGMAAGDSILKALADCCRRVVAPEI